MIFKEVYNKHYKKLFFIPLLLVVLALFVIGNNYRITGDIIAKDVTLKGGITATISTSQKCPELESYLQQNFPESDLTVRSLTEFGTDEQIGMLIEITDADEDILKTSLEEKLNLELTDENYSIELVGSSLGESFYRQMLTAIILAFLFMALVVLITFRSLIPSVAVVFAAFSDIVITIAILDLFGMKLSTAGIAALLMLIGYSIDTDILLTTKVLKSKNLGNATDRLLKGAKTGLTMTLTTIVALTASLIVTSSLILKQMFVIIIIGLIIDIISTYCMNAGLLVWYARKKHV
ncbi:MAG: MMPL family transporter [Nanoarchaeota archaeon]|nr:MMPL family transporter [Nanoarchaeota archaeon]